MRLAVVRGPLPSRFLRGGPPTGLSGVARCGCARLARVPPRPPQHGTPPCVAGGSLGTRIKRTKVRAREESLCRTGASTDGSAAAELGADRFEVFRRRAVCTDRYVCYGWTTGEDFGIVRPLDGGTHQSQKQTRKTPLKRHILSTSLIVLCNRSSPPFARSLCSVRVRGAPTNKGPAKARAARGTALPGHKDHAHLDTRASRRSHAT